MMRRRLYSLFFCCLLSALSAAQGRPAEEWRNPTKDSFGLRGAVKALAVERVDVSGERYPVQRCTFDKRGHALECIDFDVQKHGQATSRRVFHYDASENSTGYDSYYLSTGHVHPQTVKVTLDAKGRRIAQEVLSPDGKRSQYFTYKYNSVNGRVAEEACYLSNEQTPVGVTKYSYDKKGRLIDEQYVDDHHPDFSWNQHHDYNEGGLIAQTQSFKDGVLDATCVFRYDEQGRKTSATTTTSNRIPYVTCDHCPHDGRVTYDYDSAGRVTQEITYDKAGRVAKVLRFEFDEFGNPTKQDAFLNTGSNQVVGSVLVRGEPVTMKWSNGMRRTSYTYDSHGNWTRAQETIVPQFNLAGARTAASTTFRAIEYY